MVDWPATLPGPFSGIGDQRRGTKTRSNNDVGPANQRRRYTAAVRNINVPMVLTEDEREIFEAFYANDLDEGVLSFNWQDPLGGATVAMRFRGDDGPDWQGSGGGDFKTWSATLELEILP
jgi:hypothetical protein